MIFHTEENVILHQPFGSKNTVFLICENFKIMTFLYSVNMVFHAKENIILLFFRQHKYRLPRFFKYDASFVNTKERSCQNLILKDSKVCFGTFFSKME